MKLRDLKKGNKFMFNNITFVVIRKYINDDKPLIARLDVHYYKEHRFHNEDLEVEKL